MRHCVLIIALAIPGLCVAEWEHHDSAAIGLPLAPISALYADMLDRIWVGTESGGTAYYLDGRWTLVSPGVENRILGPVVGFADGMEGSLWMASLDAGLGRLDDGAWRLWDGSVGSVIPKPAGFTWGNECFDRGLWSGATIPMPEVIGGVPFVPTSALRAFAGAGEALYLLYVDRIPSAILRFQGGDHVECWPNEDALARMGRRIDVGGDGTVWVVFQETVAVKRPAEEGWESFTVPLLARPITDVMVAEGGGAYFAGSNGLYLFDGVDWQELVDYKGAASIAERDGSIWVVHGPSPPSLLRYGHGVIEELEYPSSGAGLTSLNKVFIEISSSGDLWIADEHGLWLRPYDGLSSVTPTGWGSVKTRRTKAGP